MPEGDTVWLAARRMDAALAGHELTQSDFRVPQLATSDLTGHRITRVVSRGKHLLTRITADTATSERGAWTLHTHVRMDGAWHLYRHGERWRGGPAWQVRVLLATDAWQAVGYRLPVVELFPTSQEERAVGHLGPDLLGADWDAHEALRRIGQDPEREIGPALLDQRNLAGIGNLYKAESLFLEGESPWTPVCAVRDLHRLLERARSLMEANKRGPAQVTTGDSRRGQEHWVFQRDGRPCRRCGTPVRASGQADGPVTRITWWCPSCQPGPAPPADPWQGPRHRSARRP